MGKTVEELYQESFGEKDYHSAVHSLWEDHCAGYHNCPNWPPTLEQVKTAIKQIQDGRPYENERR
jgi:hypothetical protein